MNEKQVSKVLGTEQRAWERAGSDSDRDGVVNALDCKPYDPKKQGLLHNLAAKYGSGRVKTWGEEGQERAEIRRGEREADKLARARADSEARQVARRERIKEAKKTARYREQVRAERQREYIKRGGFWGTVGRQVKQVTAPTTRKRISVRKKKGKRKSYRTESKPTYQSWSLEKGGKFV